MITLIAFAYYNIAQVHATLVILAQKGLMSTDELRRAMEALPGHKEMTYYHRSRCLDVITMSPNEQLRQQIIQVSDNLSL